MKRSNDRVFKQFGRCKVTEQINAEVKEISRLGRLYPAKKYSGIFLDDFGGIRAVERIEDDDEPESGTLHNNPSAN